MKNENNEMLKLGGADIIREVPERATAHSKHYIMSDGTEKDVYTCEPIHYFDEESKTWRDIDGKTKELDDGFEVSFGGFRTKVAKREDSEAIEVMGSNDGVISWEYLGTSNPKRRKTPHAKKMRRGMKTDFHAEKSKNAHSKFTYEGVEGNVDIEYDITASGVKENIIVKSKKKSYKYFFKFTVKGYDMKLSEDGKSIEFFKKEAVAATNGKCTSEFTIPSPYMYDATGASCNEVYYDIEPLVDTDETDNIEEYLFTVSASDTWINSDLRVFPVTIDPQLVANYGTKSYISYKTNILVDSYLDSSGGITGTNSITNNNIIKVGKDASGNVHTAVITIIPSRIEYDSANLRRAVLSLKCESIIYENHLFVNGNTVTQGQGKYTTDGDFLYIDITDELICGSEIDYNITSTLDKALSFSTYIPFAPELSIVHYSRIASNDLIHRFHIIPGVEAEYSVENSNSRIVFNDFTDPTLGINLSHIEKKDGNDFGIKGNFRLNLDETLKKILDNENCEQFEYIDNRGNVHHFKERFYYIDENDNKVYAQETNASYGYEISIDMNGQLWIEIKDGDSDFNEKHKAFRELYTDEGLIASSQIDGVKNIKWYEKRMDEEKQIEEQIKSYSNSIVDFVKIDADSGETLTEIIDPFECEKLTENIQATSTILLTKSEAISYRSLIIQNESIKNSLNSLDTQRKSLLENVELSKLQSEYESFLIKAERAAMALANISAGERKWVENNYKGTLTELLNSIEDIEIDYSQISYDDAIALSEYKEAIKTESLIGNYDDTIKKTVTLKFKTDRYPNLEEEVCHVNVPTKFALLQYRYELWGKQADLGTTKKEIEEGFVFNNPYSGQKTIVRQFMDIDSQKSNLEKQKTSICEQLEVLKLRSDTYVKTLEATYKEFINLTNQLVNLKVQLPSAYITTDFLVKGFNDNGELTVIYSDNGLCCIIEREIDESGNFRIKSVKNKDEKSINFEYNSLGYLVTLTDTIGRKNTYKYDTFGKLSKVTLADGSYIEFTEESNAINISNDKNERTILEYTGSLLSKITHYSLASKVAHNDITASDIEVSSITEEIRIDAGSFTNEEGKQTVYIIHSPNDYSVFEVINAKVSSAQRICHVPYEYSKKAVANNKYINRFAISDFIYPDYYDETVTVLNRFNKPKTVTTPWESVYDDEGNNGTTRRRSITEYSYNSDQQLIETMCTVNVMYDELHNFSNPILVDHVKATKYFYDSQGNVTRRESYIKGNELKYGIDIEESIYDENGNIIKSFAYNSLDSSSKFYNDRNLDETGRVIAESDNTGRAKKIFEYDNAGNVICEILPNGSRYAYGRDINGKITSITHSSDIGEENSTQKVFTNGLLTEVRSGNNVVHYTYDDEHRIISVNLNDGEDYITYSYSEINEEVAIEYEEATEPEYMTCTTKKITTATLKNGVVFSTVTDAKGNIIEKTVTDGTDVKRILNTFNEQNAIVTSDDSISVLERYTYDYETSKVFQIFITDKIHDTFECEAYYYNPKGSLFERYIHNNCYSYQYSGNIDRQKVHFMDYARTIRCTPKYDANDRIVGKVISNVDGTDIAEEQISYLKFGDRATNLPSTIKFGDNTDGIFAMRDTLKYRYDLMGNITEVFENGLTAVRYEYDSLGRLKREDNRAFGKTTVYSYDDNGNILAKHIYAFTMKNTDELKELTPEDTILYTYDNDSDRLLSYGNEQFIYDSIGNPTTYRGKTAEWKFGRELVAYDGNTFAYDARGRRISKNDISFVYDHTGKLIKQYRTNTETNEISDILEFIYDHTGIFAFKYGDSTFFYRKNAQNDIIAILDNTGKIVVKYTYNAWGECKVFDSNGVEIDKETVCIANLNPFRYRSYYLDTETNLYFLKTRYYDPVVGRFITIDNTSYLEPDVVNGLNLYAYCGNNPVMRVDPNGCFFEGLFSQIITSIVSYAGLAIASLFDEEIKADMDRINWNPFNSNENAVINSSKVSFYKGTPVFRFESDFLSSFSFGAIFLKTTSKKIDILKHEYGHTVQKLLLGDTKYLLGIGAPSMIYNLLSRNDDKLQDMYYSMPWERTADLFGNANNGPYENNSKENSLLYLLGLMMF